MEGRKRRKSLGSKRVLLIKSLYEPGVREFESLRARQLQQRLTQRVSVSFFSSLEKS